MLSSKTLCHEMYFYDVFCKPFSVTMEEFIFHLSYRKTYHFLAIVIVLLFAIDPNGFRAIMPMWKGFVIWVAATAAFLGTFCLLFLVYAWINMKIRNLRIFSSIISLGGFFVSQTLAAYLAHHFSGGLFMRSGPFQTGFLALAVIMIETIYFRYVMPLNGAVLRARAAQTLAPPAMAPAPLFHLNNDDSITIGTRKLRLEVLYYIASEEHYVRIGMRHETFVQRAKLADLVAQTAPGDGFQPHRSWWISINAKPRIDRTGSKAALILTDGTTAPIARGRVKDTQDWIDSHANWATSTVDTD